MDLHHPLIVHFPIALLLTGVLFDLVGTALDREKFLWSGYMLLLLGATTAIAAALTGNSAAVPASDIPGIMDDLDLHERLGSAVAWVAVLLSLFRTHLQARRRFHGKLRLIYLAVALGMAGLVCGSSYTGGLLVRDFGAGTVLSVPDASEP